MKLASNQVHLYFTYPEEITDRKLLLRYQSMLTDDEMSQMSRLYFTGHRHQYLLTRVLLRTSLSAYHPVAPNEWRFSKNSYGKPEISHPEVGLPVRFNLSHARGLIMCGVTRDVDIGVDVEDTHRTTSMSVSSLSSYFSEQEINDLGELPPEQQKQRFFDYWTLKESYIKARGKGLALPLAKFSFRFSENKLCGFSVHPELEDTAGNWCFWRIAMSGRYRVAVAVNSAMRDFEVSSFKTVPLIDREPIPLNFL